MISFISITGTGCLLLVQTSETHQPIGLFPSLLGLDMPLKERVDFKKAISNTLSPETTTVVLIVPRSLSHNSLSRVNAALDGRRVLMVTRAELSKVLLPRVEGTLFVDGDESGLILSPLDVSSAPGRIELDFAAAAIEQHTAILTAFRSKGGLPGLRSTPSQIELWLERAIRTNDFSWHLEAGRPYDVPAQEIQASLAHAEFPEIDASAFPREVRQLLVAEWLDVRFNISSRLPNVEDVKVGGFSAADEFEAAKIWMIRHDEASVLLPRPNVPSPSPIAADPRPPSAPRPWKPIAAAIIIGPLCLLLGLKWPRDGGSADPMVRKEMEKFRAELAELTPLRTEIDDLKRQISGVAPALNEGNKQLGTLQIEMDSKARQSAAKLSELEARFVTIPQQIEDRLKSAFFNSVTARELKIVDAAGKNLITLASNQEGGTLAILGKEGRPFISVGANSGRPFLSLASQGKNRVNLIVGPKDNGYLETVNASEKTTARFGENEAGAGFFTLSDNDGTIGISGNFGLNGLPNFGTVNKDGKTFASVMSTSVSGGSLTLSNNEGKVRASVGLDNIGAGDVSTYNFEGKKTADLGSDGGGKGMVNVYSGTSKGRSSLWVNDDIGYVLNYNASGNLVSRLGGDKDGGSLRLFDQQGRSSLHMEISSRGGGIATWFNSSGNSLVTIGQSGSASGLIGLYDAQGKQFLELHQYNGRGGMLSLEPGATSGTVFP